MRQEIDQDIELDKMDDTSGDENPYRELIVNNAGKIETTLSQMEQWSILSNIINYVQYDKHPKNFHTMSVRPVNKMKNKIKSRKDEKERPISEIDFRNTSDRLKEEYLDRYKGVKSEILSTTRFDENSDLSMTCLGKVNVVKENKITTEEKFHNIRTRVYNRKAIGHVPNVKYYWILELANHSCPNHTIYIANHFICYLNLLQRLRRSK